MEIKVNSKWVKDCKVARIEIVKIASCYGHKEVWFWALGEYHVLTEIDFLEQYKPYEPIYEYQYAFHTWDVDTNVTNSFFKDDTEFKKINPAYPSFQRLDFTKRERK